MFIFVQYIHKYIAYVCISRPIFQRIRRDRYNYVVYPAVAAVDDSVNSIDESVCNQIEYNYAQGKPRRP